jgi:hypothetical protein
VAGNAESNRLNECYDHDFADISSKQLKPSSEPSRRWPGSCSLCEHGHV